MAKKEIYEYDDEDEEEVREAEKIARREELRRQRREISRENELKNMKPTKEEKKITSDDETLIKLNFQNKNLVASIIKGLADLTIIIGLICLIAINVTSTRWIVFATCLLSAIFTYAIGEIIQILHDIRIKIYEDK